MEFVYPSFLYGLFAIAIPIIIHLFNFRKFKKVEFTNVRFLKEVKEETQSKSKLKHLLILLSRILAIIFLVLAFAQPFAPIDRTSDYNQNAISIFIDNSFSMDAEGENGRLLEVAKNYAIDIADSYSTTDKFQVVTNDFSGKHQHFFNREEFIELVPEIETSSKSRSIKEIIQRQTSNLSEQENSNKIIYYISDFQESQHTINNIETDSSTQIFFVPLQSNSANNIYIDSVWFESPVHQIDQAEKLHLRINNSSEKEYSNTPVKLYINNEQKAIGTFTIGANETIDSTITYTNNSKGIQSCKLEIQDYPIVYDDKYYFSYQVADSISVLYIFEKDTNPSLRSVFRNDDLFYVTYTKQDRVDYSSIANNQLVILESLENPSTGLISELIKFAENGKSIFIIPPKDLNKDIYDNLCLQLGINEFMKLDTSETNVGSINLEDKFFEGVFEKVPQNINLPSVKQYYQQSLNININSTNLLTLKNGAPYLTSTKSKAGTIYTLSSPLNNESSTLTKHALFVPTIYRMALLSSTQQQLSYEIGANEFIALKSSNDGQNEMIHVVNDNDFDIIPEIRNSGFSSQIFVHDQIEKADNYILTQGKKQISGISFNYNKLESKLKNITPQELQNNIDLSGISAIILETSQGQIQSSLNTIKEGKTYWKICIIFTLLFLTIEILLIKFWRQ